ncbi:hypothetical protein CMV_001356 [Castanea mollissima]|uniref:Uncharacterized protein n=1 Tax=Castanea mollissima TaxID=60419 RepID=A0A8J4RL16_9ROSI|nr:hypothetical protein CMV_001356 [Castanea mollissima]
MNLRRKLLHRRPTHIITCFVFRFCFGWKWSQPRRQRRRLSPPLLVGTSIAPSSPADSTRKQRQRLGLQKQRVFQWIPLVLDRTRPLAALMLQQELIVIVIDDLLSAMVGIEGRYILIKRVRGKEDNVTFQVDPSMDLALQVKEDSVCGGRSQLARVEGKHK